MTEVPNRRTGPGGPAAGSADKAEGREVPPITDFLLKLLKAMKGAQFYPERHPAFAIFCEKCHSALNPLLGQHHVLVFEAKSQRIFFDEKAVSPQLIELKNLSMECVYRRVKKFRIQEGVEAPELEGFIRAMTTDPDVVQAAGGIEKVLFAKGVKNIWANEINYQDLLYGDHPPEQPEEMFAPEEQGDETNPLHEDPLALPDDATPQLEDLVKLLQTLEAAVDVKTYGERAASLVHLVQGADPPFDNVDVCRALRVLSKHAAAGDERDASMIPHALWAIRELAEPPVNQFLIECLVKTSRAITSRLMLLFWQIGTSVIPQLLEHLATARTIHTRRVLSTTISGFSDAATPHLLNMLNDPRWFVIRNVVASLGEIGDPSAISSLEPLAAWRDQRIAKEALRAIGKIHTPQSRVILERFLVHATGELQLLAAFALGVLRNRESTASLLSMLPRRVIFTNLDLQREVIKALAKIGAEETVPTLARLFRRRSFLARRKNEELRVFLAQALARINSEEARSLLADAIDSRNKKVSKICRAAVDTRGQLGRPSPVRELA